MELFMASTPPLKPYESAKKAEIKIRRPENLHNVNRKEGNDNVCLLAWFNTGYFLCMCPFRLITLETGHYKIHKNLYQSVLCAVNLACSMWMYITEIIPVTDCIWGGNRNPADYLNVFFKLTSTLQQAVFTYTVWMKADCFLEIYQILANKYAGRKAACPSKWFQGIMCNLFFIVVLVSFFSGRALDSVSHMNLCSWTAHFTMLPLGFKYFYSPVDEQLSWTISSCVQLMLTTIVKLMSFSRRLMGHGKDAFVLMNCLTLWFPAKAFAKEVYRSSGVLTSEILAEYEALKELSAKVNDAISPLFVTFLAEAILMYSSSLKHILVLSPTGVSVAIYFFTFILCFCLAADICKQVDSLKKLLGCPQLLTEDSSIKNSSTILSLFLLNELKTNPVGISANGMFVINYSLAASVCGSLMTYFIVIIQFDH